MSIDASTGKTYNANFPVENTNNPSQQFRDNFSIIQTAVQNLQGLVINVAGQGTGSSNTLGPGTGPLTINFSLAQNLVLPGTGGLTVPDGNTAQRPSPATAGTIRYNTDTSSLEIYSSGSWTNVGGATVSGTYLQPIVVNEAGNSITASNVITGPEGSIALNGSGTGDSIQRINFGDDSQSGRAILLQSLAAGGGDSAIFVIYDANDFNGSGSGGAFVLQGGTDNTAEIGASIEIDGGYGSGGGGGTISLEAGNSAGSGSLIDIRGGLNSGNGGNLYLQGGNDNTSDTGAYLELYGAQDGAGGGVFLYSGHVASNGEPGYLEINGGSTNQGGAITLESGYGGNAGGEINITASDGGTYGGSITLQAGGSSGVQGGNIYLSAGSGTPNGEIIANSNMTLPYNYSIFLNGSADTNWRMGLGINAFTTRLVGEETSIQIVTGTGSGGPDGFAVGQTGGVSMFELRGDDLSAYLAGTLTIGQIQGSSNQAYDLILEGNPNDGYTTSQSQIIVGSVLDEGGTITLTGGIPSQSQQAGGNIFLAGAYNSNSTSTGSSIEIYGGSADDGSGNANGGNIQIELGGGGGSGHSGYLLMENIPPSDPNVANAIWSNFGVLTFSESSTATIQTAKVSLTSVQILSLHSSPVLLISAPGSGKMISIINSVYILTYGSTTYSGTVGIFYGNGSSVVADGGTGPLLSQTGSAIASVYGASGPSAIANIENQGIYVSAQSSNPTTGNGTLEVKVSYIVVSIP